MMKYLHTISEREKAFTFAILFSLIAAKYVEVLNMTNHRKHTLETKNKDISKKMDDPPVRAENSLRRDEERKREEMKKSTIGGF